MEGKTYCKQFRQYFIVDRFLDYYTMTQTTRFGLGSLGCRKIMWNLYIFFHKVLTVLNDPVFSVITLVIIDFGFSKPGAYGGCEED